MTHSDIVADLDHLGLLCVAGEGAKKLLQGQLTCNLDEISPQLSRLGAHCNPQGRIISLSRVLMYQNQYYLQLPRAILATALNALKKYAVFFKVTLTDASDSLSRLAYSGTQINKVFTHLPTENDAVIEQDNIIIIKLPNTAASYEMIGDPATIAAIEKKLALYANKTPQNTWKALEIAAGLPGIYPETSEKFLPHELNLQLLNAISFDKGCYTGQEIIARMQYKGKLKKHTYRAKTLSATPPQLGADITNNQGICGTIVDFAEVGYNIYDLLILITETDATAAGLFLDAERKNAIEILG